ncbi:MAG TPA: choline/ethanolamine kinase family protein [Mobilitalea sp.]|nr:choline/ethanolamine kinase family protein [Mobilitalea sp.]
MDINKIIATDPMFRNKEGLVCEPLNGGFSNETYIVTVQGVKYVVKINFAQNEYLNLTRKSELEAQSRAAAMGIAPKVLSDVEQSAYSISEFIDGHLMEHDEIMLEDSLVKLAGTMKKIHSISGIQRTNSAFDLIDGYVKGIDQFQVQVPEGYRDILIETEKIRNRRSLDRDNNNKYCHNDILGNNLLSDGSRIIVIDWELSGLGDPYMDLASISYSNKFSEEDDKFLLESYFGYYEAEMLKNMKDLRYVGMVREVVWAFFFAGLNRKSVNHDFDYYGAGCYVLDRIKAGHLSLW